MKKWTIVFLSALFMVPLAFTQNAPKASAARTVEVVVWVCKATKKEGTEKITIPFKAPNGKSYEVKCDVELDKGVKKEDKATAIASAIEKASQQHSGGDGISAVDSNGNIMLTANSGFQMGPNPELTNNTGEKHNKEIKGAADACDKSVCAIGFSGQILGFDGYGEESEITVGWGKYSCTAHLSDYSELEPWLKDVIKYADALGYKAAYGYDQFGTLWLLTEITPKNGDFIMRFGSTDMKLSQKALSWYGTLNPMAQYVKVENYDYIIVLE